MGREAREEAIAMWEKLFGGGDGLPRAKVDAVVQVIDRYLAEEAELRGLQSEKQTILPQGPASGQAQGPHGRGVLHSRAGREDVASAESNRGGAVSLRSCT